MPPPPRTLWITKGNTVLKPRQRELSRHWQFMDVDNANNAFLAFFSPGIDDRFSNRKRKKENNDKKDKRELYIGSNKQ